MFNMWLIIKYCFLELTKEDEKFDKNKFLEFSCLWPDFNEFIDEIFDYL